MKRRGWIAALLIALTGVAIALFLLPWKNILQNRLQAMLASRGLTHISFQLDEIGLTKAVLSNVIAGKDPPLLLQKIEIAYTPANLLSGRLDDLALSGLEIRITRNENGWEVSGLDSLAPSSSSGKFSPSEFLSSLPLQSLSLTDGKIIVSSPSFEGTIPFKTRLSKDRLTFSTAPAALRIAGQAYDLSSFSADVTNKAGSLEGRWAVSSLDDGEDGPLPALGAEGAIQSAAASLSLEGAVQALDKSFGAKFTLTADLSDLKQARLSIPDISYPLMHGTVSAKDISILLLDDKPVSIDLAFKNISVEQLLALLSGKNVVATGSLSGNLPLIVRRDGTYTIGAGGLRATQDGVIQISDAIIPGDNEQVALVREILKNLEYKVLTASVTNQGGDKIAIKFSLEGRNPNVYDGKPVKLNVNLTGDLLNLVRQNMMLLSSPEKLLRQEEKR